MGVATGVAHRLLSTLERRADEDVPTLLTDVAQELVDIDPSAPIASKATTIQGLAFVNLANAPDNVELPLCSKQWGEEREVWIKDQAHALLEGRAQDVAVGLRRAATRKQLSQGERKPVDKAADYIENNRERLRYDQALVQGLPIATGVIEGACRHLIKDRMDITGARWGLDRAEAILKLRSLKVSGDLEADLAFHFKQERRRNHPGPPIPVVERRVA